MYTTRPFVVFTTLFDRHHEIKLLLLLHNTSNTYRLTIKLRLCDMFVVSLPCVCDVNAIYVCDVTAPETGRFRSGSYRYFKVFF